MAHLYFYMLMNEDFKAGFVNIFGAPNAGKSTLLNALLGENLVITSHKVQTTRHRILGIMNDENFQIVFSDTPGIIDPQYKLHEKMMMQVKSALEDGDVAIIVHDIYHPAEELEPITKMLKLKVPCLLLLNKVDTIKDPAKVQETIALFKGLYPQWEVMEISAFRKINIDKIVPLILKHLPQNPPFYPEDSMSDRPLRFFVAEMIREQIFKMYHEEIPYHTAVIVQDYEEKEKLDIIRAEIIVSRETQKVILLGKGGALIKQLGINSRMAIEEFIQKKVHLELFVKVRPKWRDNENYLKEYGYNS